MIKKIKSTRLQAILVIAFMVIALMIAVPSCMSHKIEDTKEVAEESNETKSVDNQNDDQFLVNAAEISLDEVSLGQLAQQKGNINQVKELGKMMEDEHAKSLADLTTLAETKKVSLPTAQTENGKDAYKNLNEKSGNDFGKEYSNMMVNGHRDAITLFEKASIDCTDSDIRAWSTAALPALRTHLEHSIKCQREYEKM